MKYLQLTAILFFLAFQCFAQDNPNDSAYQKPVPFVDIVAGSLGFNTGLSLMAGKNISFGKRNQWLIGGGLRFTSTFGSDKNYLSAEPDFYDNDDKTDTLLVKRPSQSNTALVFMFSYRMGNRLEFGMNIDLIGYTFGGTKDATHIGDGVEIETESMSNQLSILLGGANDRGMLKSEFFTAYHFNQKFMLRMGVSPHVNEYFTEKELQSGNKRFRNIDILPFVGARLHF
jgi:hypothetical protein